jgi:hypothetical protein
LVESFLIVTSKFVIRPISGQILSGLDKMLESPDDKSLQVSARISNHFTKNWFNQEPLGIEVKKESL